MSMDLFKGAPNPNGLSTMYNLRDVICYADELNSLLVVAIICVTVYCVGAMALSSVAMYRAPSQFQNIRFQKRWKFLFVKYRPGTHWWSFVHLAKGVVLVAGYVILKTGLGRLSGIMFGLVAYSMLVIGFRPWRHAIVNGMESLPQTSPILCVALALFWAERDIQMDHDLAVLGASLTGECRYMSEQKCIDRFKQVLILVCLSSRIQLSPSGEFMTLRMVFLFRPCPPTA